MIDLNEDLLNHYPPQYRELLQKQVLVLDEILTNNINQYKYSQDYRLAIDEIIQNVLCGKFLGIKPSEI